METITLLISQPDVYEEVAKATDYTGSKLPDGDDEVRDRILAADDDLASLSRFWEESVLACNESIKEMLVAGITKRLTGVINNHWAGDDGPMVYEAVIEVSKSFDKALEASVQQAVRSFFITSIIGQWFKFANKDEAKDYFIEAGEMMETARRLLYSRKKPIRPTYDE